MMVRKSKKVQSVGKGGSHSVSAVKAYATNKIVIVVLVVIALVGVITWVLMQGNDSTVAGQASARGKTLDVTTIREIRGIVREEVRILNIPKSASVPAPKPTVFMDASAITAAYQTKNLNFVNDEEMTGARVCRDLGYSTCIGASVTYGVEYYDSTDGSCSGNIQYRDGATRWNTCNLRNPRSDCMTSGPGASAWSEPLAGDYVIGNDAIQGVLCQ